MAMNDDELAQWFENRRGDTSLWSDAPVKATVRRGGTVVFSLRFSPQELELLRQRAEQAGSTISDLIRSAALRCAGAPSGVYGLTIDQEFAPQSPWVFAVATCSASDAEAPVSIRQVREQSVDYVFGLQGEPSSPSRASLVET
jgi:hypothetical protein